MCGFTQKWFLAFLTSICFISSECYFPSREDITLTRFKRQSTPGRTGCFLPQHPHNGNWTVILTPGSFQPGDRVDPGTILEFKCNTQYALYPSNSHIYCLGSPIVVPQCLRTCPPIVSTETMSVKCTLNEVTVDCQTPYHGTQANIQCKSLYEDFTLALRPNRFCDDDGTWDYHLPICEPVCGEKITDATPLVIKGRVATKGDYPWVIGIYNSTQMQICGGSMITPSITLSAAHCFETTDPSKYFLAAGKYYRGYRDDKDASAQYSNVKEIKIHRDFSTDYYAFDIAILVLETPFVISKFVLPICVDYNKRYDESDLIGQTGIVAGWGYTTSVDQPSEVLKEVDIVYKTGRACELGEKFRKFFTLARDKMCGIAATPGSSACSGDSGGGLYFKSEERNEKYGRYFIRGIVSVAARDNNTFGCDATKSTLFTGVHHHAELIQSYANKNRIKGSNQSRPRPINKNTDTGDTDTGVGVKSRKKCVEYSKFAYTYFSSPDLSLGENRNKSRLVCPFEVVPLILGGTKAKPKEFPHSAVLGYDSPDGGKRYLCGGSLISENFVLSAAQCQYGTDFGMAKYVRVGDLNLVSTTDDAEAQEFDIAELIPHPDYHSPSKYNDILLIRLAGKVKFTQYVRPVCLYTDHEPTTKAAIATGWGATETGSGGNDDLLKVKLEFFSQTECYNFFAPNRKWLKDGIREASQICAGSRSESKDTCQGDSGGPLQVYHKSVPCSYSLIGVTSFGKTCGLVRVPAVYTRVSHYVDWIEKTVWP